MTEEELRDYLNKIEEEIRFLYKGNFTGKIIFKVNFKEGGIANMNLGIDQSWKSLTK